MLCMPTPHQIPCDGGAVYPDLSSRDMEVSVAQVNGYIGVSLGAEQVSADLLQPMCMDDVLRVCLH